MTEKAINSFQGGIDRDTSTNKQDGQHYYEAINMRLTSESPLSTGALNLINGTTQKVLLGKLDVILGSTTIRNKVILFVYHPEADKILMYEDDGTTSLQSTTTIFTGDLGFTETSNIISFGNYETSEIQKIYFTDGLTFFRHLNIVSESYPVSTTVSEMDIVSNVIFSPLELSIQEGGNLKAGRIQYAYQLYNKNGAETCYSPASNLVSLTKSTEDTSTLNYLGTDKGEIINKSIGITITNNSTDFNRVRLVALEYEVYGQNPIIRIVTESEIADNSTITILDTGESLGNLTLQEFRFLQNDFIPKTIEVKDNILVGGNIKYNYNSIPDEYDTRAFRWKYSGAVYSCIVKDGTNDTIVPSDLSTLPSLTEECFNPFNDLDNDIAALNEYKYDPITGTLGGRGKYIRYKFTTKQVLIDDNVKDYNYKLGYPRLISKVSSFPDNYANPLQDIGYQRNEIYRFAVEFYDLKGRPLFAKWIGDIRFPDNNELPFITYSGGKTYANILGIQFYIDLSSDSTAQEVASMISGYRIVRVERTQNTSTIIDQGVISYLGYGGDGNGISNDSEMRYSAALTPYLYECYLNEVIQDRRSEYIADLSENNAVVQNTFTLDPNHAEFISPKVLLEKKTNSANNTKIDVVGYLANKISAYITQRSEASLVADKYNSFTGGTWSASTRFKGTPSTSKLYSPIDPANTGSNAQNDASLYTLNDTKTFNNQCANFAPNSGRNLPHYSMRGTFELFSFNPDDISTRLAIPTNPTFVGNTTKEERIMLANITVNRNRGLYGGTSYLSRKNNFYIPASELFVDGDTYQTVYGGDTYINTFIYLRGIYNPNVYSGAAKNQSILMFPCESRYNLNLRNDDIQKYMQWGRPNKTVDNKTIPNYALRETVSDGVTTWGTYYPTEIGNLYRYNTAFSSEDKSFVFSEKPFDFSATETIDTRISVSDKKIPNEYTDSWLKWRFNNFIDVDSRYHEIIRLINVNNIIYFGQPQAIGRLAINDRSLISDGNSAQISLGTGGVLERYDYLTTNSGISTHNAITKSDKTFYYVDELRKRFYGYFSNGDEPISILKGLASYMDGLSFNSIELEYDPEYSEVLANIDGTIVVFNELVNAFTGFYSFNPDRLLRIGRYLYAAKKIDSEGASALLINDEDIGLIDDDPIVKILLSDSTEAATGLYRLNSGNPGAFYSEVGVDPVDCSVTLIINPNGTIVNAYDSIDFRTDCKTTAGVYQPYETFNELVASNNNTSITKTLTYSQNKDVKGTIEKIANMWRTQLIQSTAYSASFKRLVDTHVILKLTYTGTGKHFKLHDIVTSYRPIKR